MVDDAAKNIASLLRADLLALAFLGALVALSFWPPQDRRQAIIKVGAGTCISAASSPAIYYAILWEWPTFPVETAILGTLYFWVGLLGMKLVPLAFGIVERFTKSKASGSSE